MATRINGPINLDVLERSLAAIVDRHEALRTRFELQDSEPVQVVDSHSAVELRRLDLSGVAGEGLAAETHRVLVEETRLPFDLVRGPLIRALAAKTGADEHILLITLHHIVSDGWSLGVLLRELGGYYNAFAAGQPLALAPLEIQYADYALWQREWLQDAELERQTSYWREQLHGAPPELQLQADRARPPIRTSRGDYVSIALPPRVSEALSSLARKERSTLFMTLLAAFQTLLMRHTDQEDLTVGSPIAGRNRSELEPLIGFFVNTLVLRSKLNGDPTFREFLSRVRRMTLGAYSHQDLPFERLLEELRPDRTAAQMPFCQAMFVLQNTERATLEIDGARSTPYAIVDATAKCDISLVLRDGPDGLQGRFEYSTDVFVEASIARMATQFERLLESVCANPDQRLSQLPLLSDAERHQILVEWNRTAVPYPRDRAATRVFEDQVTRTPDAVAVVSGTEGISYAHLNAWANRLARSLQRRGVGRGARVGILIERSIEQVVAALGVLKAGAAYLPLDLHDPIERLRFAIDDAGASPVLVHARTAPRLASLDVPTLRVDEAKGPLAERSENLEHEPRAQDLAYVMYTSGSTGTRKAVAIVHRGIVRLVRGASYVTITAADRILHAAPLSFDASTFEIWGALLNGATLVQVPVEQPSLAEIGSVLERQRVSIAWLTSALFTQIVDHELDRLRRVGQVLAGGDVLSVPHVERFLEAANGSTLINGYGPTENTTFTCCHRMTKGAVIAGSVPIGRPISNTQVYILDPHGNPQPVGIPGELYCGGDGLATGYWNRPELTAERFVPNPFDPDRQDRVYRTGDRARYREDGTIEFLGRVDHQAKIRGFRVELGEVEAALTRLPGITEAAVTVEQRSPGDTRLMAYVVGPRTEVAELRQALGRQLPDYMVPSVVTVLPALPKTTAGKIDRRLLPAMGSTGRKTADVAADRPLSNREGAVARIWREVLQIEHVGIDDNFFDLGGHSLLATQIVARIRSEIGIDVSVRAVFEGPTIAALCARMDSGGRSHGDCLVALQPNGFKTPFFFVHSIGGEVHAYSELARLLDPERPFYGLRAPHCGQGECFPSVEELAAHHLTAVRRAAPKGPYLLGGYSSGATLAYEMAQQLVRSGERVPLVVALDSNLPNMNLGRARSVAAWRRSVVNMYWWLIDDLMEAERREIVARIRSKWTLLATKLAKVKGLGWLRPKRQTDIRDTLGIPWVPVEWGGLLEQHFISHRQYVPQPYSGKVALFKARTRPLLRVSEHDLGWSAMAKGGVEVHVVRGSHANLLREPNVRSLAKVLRESLNRAEEQRLPSGGNRDQDQPDCSGP